MKTINTFINIYVINGVETRDYMAYEQLDDNRWHLLGADNMNNRKDIITKEEFEVLVEGRDLDSLLTSEEMNDLIMSSFRRPE